MSFRDEHDAQAARINALESELAEARRREREHADTLVQLAYVRAKLAQAERDALLNRPKGARARLFLWIGMVGLMSGAWMFVRGPLAELERIMRYRAQMSSTQCCDPSVSAPSTAPTERAAAAPMQSVVDSR